MLFGHAPLAVAETAFVTEQLEVPIRSGESREYRIVRYLKAGTEVTVLDVRDSGYAAIQDTEGREGFILNRYLVSEPPAFVRLDALELELTQRVEEVRRLSSEVEALRQALSEAERSATDAKDRLIQKESELNEFLATAGDSIALRNRLITLETERQALLADNQTLRAEKLVASDDSAKTWFGLGALTLAVGWFAGFLMPRIRRARVDTTL
jgi:SH3 domain protein